VPLYLAGEFVGDVPSDYNKGKNVSVVKLQLIPFKNETQGQTKAD
jgi:hypothetical protein